jgi:hypothetical protein
VNLNELLALLGRAWTRLLIFPGGLAAFAAIWALALVANREPRTQNRSSIASRSSRLSILGSLIPPWLMLALLPLPPAPGLSRQLDLIAALALLECPLLLAIADDLAAGTQAARQAGRRLAAALNGYPALLLASLALAQASGSFEIATLARVPGDLAPAYALPLHWVGAAGWALALPPMLGIGAFSAGAPLPLGMRLRAIGLVLLAALPWMAAFGTLEEGGLRTPRGLAAWALSPLVLGSLLWAYHRLTARHSARMWARAYLALDIVLLLALLWAAYQALQARLA